MKFYIITALLLTCSIGYPLDTDNPLPDNKLDTCLTYAANNSPKLAASFATWKAALEQVPQSQALSDPKFTFGYFASEVETKVGPQQRKYSLAQQFPWFGKLQDRSDIAMAQAEIARQKFEFEKLDLFLQVKKQWYEYAFLAKSLELARQNLELVTYNESIARSKYQQSAAAHPDIIRAQIELAVNQDIVSSLEKLLGPQCQQLQAAMNLPQDFTIAPPALPESQQIQPNRNKVFDSILTANPQIIELTAALDANQSQIELANKQSYPDFTLGLDWIETGKSTSTVNDSGKDPLVLMFSVNLPIWSQKNKAAQKQAAYRLQATEMQKVERQNQLLARASELIYQIEDAARKMELYNNTLGQKAEELVKVSETAYRNGTADFLSLIDAQRKQIEYKLKYYRAQTDYLKSIATLEALTTTELE